MIIGALKQFEPIGAANGKVRIRVRLAVTSFWRLKSAALRILLLGNCSGYTT